MRNLLRRIFGSSADATGVTPAPVVVRPGDDLVISFNCPPHNVNVTAELNALQASFPSTRIHLLIGCGGVTAHRNGKSQPTLKQIEESAVEYARANPQSIGEQGNVIVLRHASNRLLIAISTPVTLQKEVNHA